MGEIPGINLFRMGQEFDPNRHPMGAFCAVCGIWDYWFIHGMCEGCFTAWEEKNAPADSRRVLR